MKSALLLLSGLASTCLGAAVRVPQPGFLARGEQSKQTVTVVVTLTSTYTLSSSTKKPTQSGTVVWVTLTSTVTKSPNTPITTYLPATTPATTAPGWGPWNSDHHPPWWTSWFTQGNPVTVTDTVGLGPVTVYSPVYITVTATETDPDDNRAATVTLPALTRTAVVEREESHLPVLTDAQWHHSSWWHHQTSSDDPDVSVTTVYIQPSQSTISTVYVLPPQQVTSTVTVFVTPTSSSSSETARITFYPPRNAAPEPEPQVLGQPSRTVQESPTPPFPWWWPWATETPDGDRVVNEKREPQELGRPSRTVLQSPTPPAPWWWSWPTSAPVETDRVVNEAPEKREPQALGLPSRTVLQSPTRLAPWWWGPGPADLPAETDRVVNELPKKREPQTLGRPSRTILQSPTPPAPWWWGSWPTAAPVETDRVGDEKRDPQTLNFGPSRTVQESPTAPSPWWWLWPIETSFSKGSVEKREPQTLNLGSRTVIVAPPSPTLHHPSHHHSTTTPYEIDATATLSMITLVKKDPQILYSPSRTIEVSPTGPTHHQHSTTDVSTVYVTVTEFPPDATSSPHHHTHSSSISVVTIETIETIVYSTDDSSYYTPQPTGTLIESTITLPFIINTPTPLKRNAEPEPEPQSLSLGWPIPTTPVPHPTGKENPCQNNIFSPPAWCFAPTRTSIITITYSGTVIENTATLPPIIFSDPGDWHRKGRRARLSAEKEVDLDLEERQLLLGTQSRTFTYSPETTTAPSK